MNKINVLLIIFLIGWLIQFLKIKKIQKRNLIFLKLKEKIDNSYNFYTTPISLANDIIRVWNTSTRYSTNLLKTQSYLQGPNQLRFSPFDFILNFRNQRLFEDSLIEALHLFSYDLGTNFELYEDELKKIKIEIFNPFNYIYNAFELFFHLIFEKFNESIKPLIKTSKILTNLTSLVANLLGILKILELFNPTYKITIANFIQNYIN